MTPEERALIIDLFDRLETLESSRRDVDAQRTIREGLTHAPNAVYALVQTVLVQDEALKLADGRIRELEDELDRGGSPERQEGGGFLDNVRDSLFGRDEPRGQESRGSVPRAGGRSDSMGVPPSFRTDRGSYAGEQAQGGSPWSGQSMQAGASPSRGGSFLGTAAAAAAGAIGGGLLMNSMQGLFGGQKDGPFAGAFDKLSGKEAGGANAGELGRNAGLGDISGDRRASLADTGTEGNEHQQGWDQASADEDFISDDFDDDGGFDSDLA